jgi:Tfp pilus assembly protein FimT
MLIVLIAGFTSAVSTKWFWNYRTQQDIILITQLIEQARLTAQMKSSPTRICPASDTKLCGDDWRSGLVLQSQDKILYRLPAFSKNIQITFNRKTIDFDQNGFCRGTNGTILYSPPPAIGLKPVKIVINRAGRIRIESAS